MGQSWEGRRHVMVLYITYVVVLYMYIYMCIKCFIYIYTHRCVPHSRISYVKYRGHGYGVRARVRGYCTLCTLQGGNQNAQTN